MTLRKDAPAPSVHDVGPNHYHGLRTHQHDGEPGHDHGGELWQPAVPAEPDERGPIIYDHEKSFRPTDPSWTHQCKAKGCSNVTAPDVRYCQEHAG